MGKAQIVTAYNVYSHPNYLSSLLMNNYVKNFFTKIFQCTSCGINKMDYCFSRLPLEAFIFSLSLCKIYRKSRPMSIKCSLQTSLLCNGIIPLKEAVNSWYFKPSLNIRFDFPHSSHMWAYRAWSRSSVLESHVESINLSSHATD